MNATELTCNKCGAVFARSGKRGRPRSECYGCTPAGAMPSRSRSYRKPATATVRSSWETPAAAAAAAAMEASNERS
jgi:hypothetical protein